MADTSLVDLLDKSRSTKELEEIGLGLITDASASGDTHTKEDFLTHLRDIAVIIGQLTSSARSRSNFEKKFAEDKSLRQPDNTEGRTDLYSYAQPSETQEGKAATMLAALTAQTLHHYGVDVKDIDISLI